MLIQTFNETLSIITLFARSIMERIGLRSRDGIFYSAAALKKYLYKQPANSPDKTITVAVKANRFTLKKIIAAIDSAGKYVSLDMSASPLTTIPTETFSRCESLASVTIPSSVSSIEYFVFSNCTSLSSVTIPDGVTTIGTGTFKDCAGLASVTIPGSVTSIGDSAFEECTSLSSVTIPSSVNRIGDGAFCSCASLTTINVDSGNGAYASDNGVLYSKDKKTLVAFPAGKTETSFIIPDGVSRIESYAFTGCDNLASVTIPDGVTNIGCWAFYNCASLASVTIPSGVSSIEEGAFEGCASLSSVTFKCTILSSSFSNGDSFPGDLREKFYAADSTNGTPGTYARASGGSTWTRQ